MNEVRTLADIEYGRVGNTQLLLDMVLPQGAAHALPVLVWIHGGGWHQGDKGDITPGWGESWANEGYAAVSINYRLTDEATFPAQIHDCKGAIRWLRAHADDYDLDPKRIGVWGSSAGGHLAALLGTTGGVASLEGDLGCADQPSDVQAVCAWMAPTHLYSMAAACEHQDYWAPDSVLSALLGGQLSEHEDQARAASPATWVSGDEPPFLIAHGDADTVVPYQQALVLHDRLLHVGVDTALYTFQGAGHGRGPFFAHSDLMDRVRAFFARHLVP